MADLKRPTPDQVNEELPSLIALAENLRLSALERLRTANLSRGAGLVRQAGLEQARSERDSASAQEVTERLVRLRERQADLEALRQAAQVGQNIPPNSVAILGRVVDNRGRPAQGLRVILSNRKRLKSPIGENSLQSGGFYRIVVPQDQFDEYFKRSREIVVSVIGPKRKVLAQQRRPTRPRHRMRVINFGLPAPSEGQQRPG